MQTQMPLDFTTAHARASDPQTSHDAAASLQSTELEFRVLDALVTGFANGATSIQLAEHLHMAPWSVSPRMRPLCEKGFVMDSGRRLTGTSGRKSIVWIPVARS
jgi:hypothetical protein